MDIKAAVQQLREIEARIELLKLDDPFAAQILYYRAQRLSEQVMEHLPPPIPEEAKQ